MKPHRVALLVGLVTLTSGCGKRIKLDGTVWRTDCGVTAGGKTEVQQVAFSDKEMVYTRKLYDADSGKSGCIELDYQIAYTYAYTLIRGLLEGQSFLDDFDGLDALDATLTTVNLTPQTDKFVTDANAASLCGQTDWAKSQAKSLIGLSGSTLANCGTGLNVGSYTGGNNVKALDEARPFGFKKYDATPAQVVIDATTAIFTSVGEMIFNSDERMLGFAKVTAGSTDGTTADKRAIIGKTGVGTSASFYKKSS